MLRTLPAAVAATGVVAATTLCCSDTSAPTRAAAPRTALVASSAASGPTLTPQQSGTTDRLQPISPVSPRVAWASGVGGTYVVTTDGEIGRASGRGREEDEAAAAMVTKEERGRRIVTASGGELRDNKAHGKNRRAAARE